MYEVLDKDTIKSEILPYLSVAKRGYVTKSDLVEVIQCIRVSPCKAVHQVTRHLCAFLSAY